MTLFLATRPDEWDLPLFLHVLGALTLIGAVVLGLLALTSVWRGGTDSWRLAYRAIVWVAIPAWFVMRLTAQWLLDEEGLEDAELAWIDIGFQTAEPTLILLIIAGVISRVKKNQAEGGADPGWGGRVAVAFVAISLVAYLVALWAMTTKPS